MAIQTRGHQLSVMPQVAPVDARLYAMPDIFSAARQGAGLVGQFTAMQEDAEQRPVRKALLEAQLANVPLQAELARISLAKARNEAALPLYVPGDIEMIDETQFYPAAIDEEGQPTGPGDTVVGNLLKRQKRQQIVNGQLVEAAPLTSVVKTAEQRVAEKRKLDAEIAGAEALAASRDAKAALDEARASGQGYSRIGTGVDPATGKLGIVMFNKATGDQYIMPTGLEPVSGGNDLATAIASLVGGTAKPAAAATPTFANEAEAAAAAAAGRIKPGDTIVVGNQRGKWQ